VSGAPRITPVLLCGGAGTRLWPLSRGSRPKQLLALTGEETMLQQTARRAAAADMFGPPVLIAGAGQADEIERQLGAIGIEGAALILEPCARNTAPALALAALAAPPGALLLAMPSDHVIADEEGFRRGVAAAAPFAAQGWLATFGIRATRPETGYGYIAVGPPLADGVFEAAGFVEKPPLAQAEAYLAAGNHAWNAGIFLFGAEAFLAALGAHAPDILRAAEAAMAAARSDGARLHPDPAAFAASPSLSVDHAVMEKAARIAVVPLEIGWSDVGSWDALYDVSDKDGRFNALAGDVVALDSTGCLVRTEGPLVVVVGVHDLVVVADGDRVLVMPRAESQRVRDAVAAVDRERPGRA
jgi:mannose-1-phosphate guanylyltransferase/mannose-1-phosphate guanylyltransferase/mannose-6-phosphate isomerase